MVKIGRKKEVQVLAKSGNGTQESAQATVDKTIEKIFKNLWDTQYQKILELQEAGERFT